ncbi:unnamed protein product [Caenorhabditis sp. 36 PRJEB53466]|nr:unnamed protein product [Caenorhabditis sp. 36 PRJEB53466]
MNPKFTTDLNGKKCVKCDLEAHFTGVDPKKAWYCKECFIQMVRNKFRSALSKKKIFKDAEARDTLVVYDGSPSATFLLNQINDAVNQITYKRLMIQPTILVLVSVTDDDAIQMVMNRVQEIKKELVTKARWIVAHVAYCMYSGSSKELSVLEDSVCNGLENIGDYTSLLGSCSVPTYRKELERILKEKCLLKIGSSLGISKCMVPDDADDLGRLALNQLCLGRGGSLSKLVSAVDKRTNCMFIRPLLDVSKKEIAVYNYLCEVDKFCVQLKERNEPKSVQTLTDNFIRTLEAEKFYSTINTVMSTAAKIHSNGADGTPSSNSKCM